VPLGHFPLLVDDSERDVFVGNSSAEANRQRVCCAILLEIKLWGARLIRQIWVEDVELVALDNFGRRILRIVVRLVVLVPFVTLLHAVEEAWLTHDK